MEGDFKEKYGRILISTLGHVDHGKSTLVKALTGVDPDRLPEEKILDGTTDLGFAFFKANNGKLYGFIDVPGHRDYIKNLITGILNAHFYILVVDAQEGVMPQTIEHTEIVKCLNLKHGLVVVSKIDLVSEQKVKEIKEEIELLYSNYNLESIPIVAVSFTHNIGIEELKNKLSECLNKTPPYVSNSKEFILAVMRGFSVQGRGTVITGPVVKGRIKVGDVVYSEAGKSVIREINIFKESVDVTFSGVTTALNLPDIEVNNARRGIVIRGGEGPEFITSRKCLVLLKHSEKIKKYLKKKTFSIIIFMLTYNHPAKLIFLKHFNDFSICKVIFDAFYDMYSQALFICYSKDLKELLGGGNILYTNISKLKNKKPITSFVENFDYDSYTASPIEYLVLNLSSQFGWVSFDNLDILLNTTDYRNILKDNTNFIISDSKVVNIKAVSERIVGYLQNYHTHNPYMHGLKAKDFSVYLQLPYEIVKQILQNMVDMKKLSTYLDFYFLPDFKIKQDNTISNELQKVKKLFLENSFITYSKSEIENIFQGNKKALLVFEKLMVEGEIIHIGDNRWISKEGVERIKEILYKNKSRFICGFSPKDLKPLLGDLSRKHLIPILEYMDKIKVTKRQGEKRFIT